MTYLLDTDHLSILQRKAGGEYLRLSTWMAQFTAADFACCVVSLHEQVVGAHAFLNQAKNSAGLIRDRSGPNTPLR
jgi:tRNA(fMet)-specific endonuclease VapC